MNKRLVHLEALLRSVEGITMSAFGDGVWDDIRKGIYAPNYRVFMDMIGEVAEEMEFDARGFLT